MATSSGLRLVESDGLHAAVEGEGELQQVVAVELVDGARRDGGHARRWLLLIREVAVRVAVELVTPPVGAAPGVGHRHE
eukprot:scaffold11353_cov62-Phaeocystis_antarctica.AAC.3